VPDSWVARLRRRRETWLAEPVLVPK